MNYLDAIDFRVSRRCYMETPVVTIKKKRFRRLLTNITQKEDLSFEWIEKRCRRRFKVCNKQMVFKNVRSAHSFER